MLLDGTGRQPGVNTDWFCLSSSKTQGAYCSMTYIDSDFSFCLSDKVSGGRRSSPLTVSVEHFVKLRLEQRKKLFGLFSKCTYKQLIIPITLSHGKSSPPSYESLFSSANMSAPSQETPAYTAYHGSNYSIVSP